MGDEPKPDEVRLSFRGVVSARARADLSTVWAILDDPSVLAAAMSKGTAFRLISDRRENNGGRAYTAEITSLAAGGTYTRSVRCIAYEPPHRKVVFTSDPWAQMLCEFRLEPSRRGTKVTVAYEVKLPDPLPNGRRVKAEDLYPINTRFSFAEKKYLSLVAALASGSDAPDDGGTDSDRPDEYGPYLSG